MKSLFNSKYLVPIKEYEKKFLAFCKTTSANTEKSAKDDSKNPPPPDTQLSVLPTVSATENSCRTILADCNTSLRGYLDVALSSYDQLYAKVGVLLQTSQTKLNKLQSLKSNALSVVVSVIKSKETQLVKGINIKKVDLKNLVQELKESKRVNIFWQCAIAITLNIVFMAGDTAYVAKSFSLVGLSRLEQYAIAIVLGLATGLIGAGVVESFRAKWNVIQKFGVILVLIAIVIGGYMVVGQLRVDLLARSSAEGVALSELSAFKFALINMLIFSAVIIVHALAWPSNAKWKLYRDFKNAKAEVKEAEKEIKDEEKELDNLPKELAKKQSIVAKEYDNKIDTIENFQQENTANLEQAQTQYNNIFGCCTEFHQQINTFFRKEVGRYVAIMNKYRNDDYYMLIDGSIKDLPNPFDKYKYADEELPQLETNDVSLIPDININFDKLLTEVNNNDYEEIIKN
jgi:hypothetical protein